MLDFGQALLDSLQHIIIDNPQPQRTILDFQRFPSVPVTESQGLSQFFPRSHVVHPFIEQSIEEAEAIPFRQGTYRATRLAQRIPEVEIGNIL
jgi:hypothetical protein